MSLMEQWVQRMLLLMAVLLVFYSGFLGSKLTWLLVSPEKVLMPPSQFSDMEVGNTASRGVAKGTELNVSALSQWQLFGSEQADVAPKAQPVQAIKAPETNLNLSLLGVFVAERPEDSTAIIGTSQASDDALVYAIGDSIAGSATLDAVYSDRVLLNRNGRIETLNFPSDASAGLTVSSREVPQGQGRLENESARSLPEDFTQNLINQSDMALKFMGLESAGPGEGYLITDGAPQDILNSLPLQVGDRVLSINGIALGDPLADQEMLGQFLDQRSVQVELQRGQTRMTIEVDVADLMGGR